MNDIKPVRRPQKTQVSPPGELPKINLQTPTPLPPPKKRSKKLPLIAMGAIGFIVVAIAVAFFWYQQALRPVAEGAKNTMSVKIVEGSSPSQIGQLLQAKGLIRSSLVFDVYTKLTDTRSSLQAGTYQLSPTESVQQIVDHLVAGRVDQFSLTFYPGAMLTDTTDTPADKKTDAASVLLRAGYSKDEIDKAFAKSYDHPLFQSKPASAGLEGYVYGETYNFDSDATVEQILERTFDEYYAALQENDLIKAFKKRDLTLYQGITLASIVQGEVPDAKDQKQVAQVFFKRLHDDMPLGSDVTYKYAAKKLGVDPTPELDSPYNTRKVKGLPPGPVATPGLSALKAVAAPASGSYVYFLSGDDDVSYFAYTVEEHEANIRDHCQIKCSTY